MRNRKRPASSLDSPPKTSADRRNEDDGLADCNDGQRPRQDSRDTGDREREDEEVLFRDVSQWIERSPQGRPGTLRVEFPIDRVEIPRSDSNELVVVDDRGCDGTDDGDDAAPHEQV